VSLDVLGDLNWPAVLVAALAYWLLGALWWAPFLFGSAWARSIGWEPPPDAKPGATFMVGTAAMALLAAVAVGMLAEVTGADGLGEGLVLGLVLGLGVAGAALLGVAASEPTRPRPWTWLAIDGGYHLVGLLLAAAIVAVW
jgi:hypothetical protein